jgi:hypothetical protein
MFNLRARNSQTLPQNGSRHVLFLHTKKTGGQCLELLLRRRSAATAATAAPFGCARHCAAPSRPRTHTLESMRSARMHRLCSRVCDAADPRGIPPLEQHGTHQPRCGQLLRRSLLAPARACLRRALDPQPLCLLVLTLHVQLGWGVDMDRRASHADVPAIRRVGLHVSHTVCPHSPRHSYALLTVWRVHCVCVCCRWASTSPHTQSAMISAACGVPCARDFVLHTETLREVRAAPFSLAHAAPSHSHARGLCVEAHSQRPILRPIHSIHSMVYIIRRPLGP